MIETQKHLYESAFQMLFNFNSAKRVCLCWRPSIPFNSMHCTIRKRVTVLFLVDAFSFTMWWWFFEYFCFKVYSNEMCAAADTNKQEIKLFTDSVVCLVRFCDSIMFGALRLIIASLKSNVILMLPRQKNYAWIFISIIIEMTCTKWTCITKSLAHYHYHHYWQNLF